MKALQSARRNPRLSRRTLLKGLLGVSGILAQSFPSMAQKRTSTMHDDLTAGEIRMLLALQPNATCGYVRETFRSATNIAPGGLPAPFSGGRPLGSALYFMVAPDQHVKLHRIRNDQLYHYYLGDPLEVFLLHSGGAAERVVVGPDLRNRCSRCRAFRLRPRRCRLPLCNRSCRDVRRSMIRADWCCIFVARRTIG